MSWAASKYGPGGKPTGNKADANGKVEDPNGQEGVETFEAAQKELIRQKKSFASKAKYKDGYMVAYFDENGNLVEPREFAADDWAGALAHAKKQESLLLMACTTHERNQLLSFEVLRTSPPNHSEAR